MGKKTSNAGRPGKKLPLLLCLGLAGLSYLLQYQLTDRSPPPSKPSPASEESEMHVYAKETPRLVKLLFDEGVTEKPGAWLELVPVEHPYKTTSLPQAPLSRIDHNIETERRPWAPTATGFQNVPVNYTNRDLQNNGAAQFVQAPNYPPVTNRNRDPREQEEPLPPVPLVDWPPPPDLVPPPLVQVGGEQVPLDRPLESVPPPVPETIQTFQVLPNFEAPLGFTGRSSVRPRPDESADEKDPHFIPMEDRWRSGFPYWDRYGKGHPANDDYPYVEGHWWDPYNQNVLKGDYPIIGQNIFLNVTGSSRSIIEPRQVPVATTPFESTLRPNTDQFFGRPNQFGFEQYFALSLDLFRGDGAFRPVDWRVKITPVFNINVLSVDELAEVNPNVARGTYRGRTFFALEEYFAEIKLADLSPNYDFVSVRAGSQPFTSDFRGFIFSDLNRGVRLFGNLDSNRIQFNLAYFDMLEKDTNSELNTFDDRGQRVVIANTYIQDFLFPGYTTEFSFHYNHDDATMHFDQNNILVRPDPVGTFQPHTLDVFYLGWAGDGHVGRFNVDHAFYWALGHDTLNPMANSAQSISAQMAALELSYDRDWIRFRTSFFWASGDKDPNNHHATGFDSILDNPNFAGGEFSYWQRQAIGLLGTNLTNRGSLLADLRASKIEGQANFVNPGVALINLGMDFDVTPKIRLIANTNFLWFDNTAVLRQYVYQNQVARSIGTDLSLGVEYRPFLNNNVIMKAGVSTLVPGQGFHDLYDNLNSPISPLVAAFMDLILTF